MPARCQAYRNAFTFDPLFLFEVTSTEGPTTSSLSPAPSEILPSDKSSSKDTSKFSMNSRALWTFINFLATILYSYNTQTKELADDAKVKKQTANL